MNFSLVLTNYKWNFFIIEQIQNLLIYHKLKKASKIKNKIIILLKTQYKKIIKEQTQKSSIYQK